TKINIIFVLNFLSNMIRSFILLLVFVSLSVKGLQAQETNADKVEWQIYSELNGVQIYYKNVECNDVHNGIFAEYVYLQIVNTTSIAMNVSWDEEIWRDNKCLSCGKNPAEFHKEIILDPGDILEPDCKTKRSLKIFSKFLNNISSSKLTKFKLNNLTINPL
ncbi:MAG: hypothetical protein J7L46_03100, partial [Bacteroidales bacterium]|nr:hypothetical protein [Bacteroidales bacterium]